MSDQARKNMIEINKVYNADALDILRQIPDNSIDLILTDPPFMISQEIKIFQGDIVLDPFAGSGSTIVASINLNRNYIGIERDKDFHEKILERIKTLQIRLGI